MRIGVQSLNVIDDSNPAVGFKRLRTAGFTCCDFGLNGYLVNRDIYRTADQKNGAGLNVFFDKGENELAEYFNPHIIAAKEAGIIVNQMHMPYPVFVPGAPDSVNDYLRETVAMKSLYICSLFNCRNIVIHGFKLKSYLGTEEGEWKKTTEFLDYIAPTAKEYGITMCIENLYTGGKHIVEGPCCDAAKAAERIDAMNEKYGAEVLGFCLDTGHANLTGLDFESFITRLGSRLKVLHIHDNDGISDLHQVPFTFTRERNNQSTTDWAGFIRGLRNINFDGVLNFETAPVLKSFPLELHDEILKMIAAIGLYFKEKIEM